MLVVMYVFGVLNMNCILFIVNVVVIVKKIESWKWCKVRLFDEMVRLIVSILFIIFWCIIVV